MERGLDCIKIMFENVIGSNLETSELSPEAADEESDFPVDEVIDTKYRKMSFKVSEMIVCLSTVQKLNRILFVHKTNRVYGKLPWCIIGEENQKLLILFLILINAYIHYH